MSTGASPYFARHIPSQLMAAATGWSAHWKNSSPLMTTFQYCMIGAPARNRTPALCLQDKASATKVTRANGFTVLAFPCVNPVLVPAGGVEPPRPGFGGRALSPSARMKLVAHEGVAPSRPKTLRSKRSVSAVPPMGRRFGDSGGLGFRVGPFAEGSLFPSRAQSR